MTPHHKPRLLVSVRTAAEAVEALAGGAEIIDIKEPAHGPLGRAGGEVWRQVIETVGHKAPISVALGELQQAPPHRLPKGVAFAKVGLAQAPPDWEHRLLDYEKRLGVGGFVPVAYADWQSVAAPPVESVLAWACRHRVATVMIDTANKRGNGLFDWATPDTVAQWITKARRGGVAIALAGSLRGDGLVQAIDLIPDIVGVRGAACRGGDRMSRVDAQHVRALTNLIATHTATPAAHAG